MNQNEKSGTMKIQRYTLGLLMSIILTIITLTLLPSGQYMKSTEEIFSWPNFESCVKVAHLIMDKTIETDVKKTISATCTIKGTI